MAPTYSHRYVLRAVIEFTTPSLVGSGAGNNLADAVSASDANGLPAIPGSSLAGALRAAFRQTLRDPEAENRVFGFQAGDAGQGSRLVVSWACIHDSQDRPVEGIVGTARLADPVLAVAMSPEVRDHVRINHLGASDTAARGKFDEQALCAGHRFTFELELIGKGTSQDQADWDALLSVLADPSLRLGSKTRRGFGAFAVQSIRARQFDLRTDLDEYRLHPVSLAERSPSLRPLEVSPARPRQGSIEVLLTLRPRGFWLFGGGSDIDDAEGRADITPVRASRVEWHEGHGSVARDLIFLPASAIKGALAHRVAFHYNALTGVFADELAASDTPRSAVLGENNPAVRALFGFCKTRQEGESGPGGDGQRGRVLLEDAFLQPPVPPQQLVHHVGIDRFTGGARDQVLFSERPLWQGVPIRLNLLVMYPDAITEASVRRALWLAVDDLVGGRLQVGAGSGRGVGYFDGEAVWPAGVDWSA